MSNFRVEQTRTQSLTALDRIRTVFPNVPDCADAVFLSADRREALGPWLRAQSGSLLFCVKEKTISLNNVSSPLPLPESIEDGVRTILDRVLRSPGTLNERGELELDPRLFSRAFDEPMRALGKSSVNLLRCAWAGSQKHVNAVWSGDVPSTFEALRDQLQARLNMGLAGIPWWTTDIGGFMTDDVNDPDFQQLLIRRYEFAVFFAILRILHTLADPYGTA